MQIDNLDDFDPGSEFEADIAIIGAGPAGITIAREFLNSPYRVLLIESGLVEEHEPHMALNQVESEGEPAGEAAINFRRIFHGPNMGSFNQQAQPYGMRVWRIGEILGRQVRDLRPDGFCKARLGTFFGLAGQS
jgi:choline dehydrogenase-like flavoprotein